MKSWSNLWGEPEPLVGDKGENGKEEVRAATWKCRITRCLGEIGY